MDDSLGSCAAGEPFALQVLDSSMEPEFKKSTVIIIDPEGILRDACFVMAKLAQDDYIFRQLRIAENGAYSLHALEEGHEVIAIGGRNDLVGVIVQQQFGKGRKGRTFYNKGDV